MVTAPQAGAEVSPATFKSVTQYNLNVAVHRTHTLQAYLHRHLTPFHKHYNLYSLYVWRLRRWHLHLLAIREPWLHYPGRYWLSEALCVHRGEGTWSDDTGNGFYGGMQFDSGTWLGNGGGRFAPYAYEATPDQQLRVSYQTWRSRGWSPWPVTSAACGL